MAAEVAIVGILKGDATLAAELGGVGTARVHILRRPQTGAFPAIVIRRQDIEPSDTKDGVSTLDQEYIQVLMYGKEGESTLNTLILNIEARVRTLLDRVAPGTYNGVVIQSSQFIDSDIFEEVVDNTATRQTSSVDVIEHIYKVRVKR